METPNPLLDLAVRYGLLTPEAAARNADARTAEELVGRGVLSPEEGWRLVGLLGDSLTGLLGDSGAATRLARGIREVDGRGLLDTEKRPETAGAAPRRIGRYDVLGELGRGGMGTVYKALDTELQRTVAVKVLREGPGEEMRVRFHREARAVAALQHPRIVRVHDIGEDGGRLYFVMECVEGASLLQAVADRSLDLREAVEVVRQAAEGVAHAHRHGVLHRDVKPANILVTPKKQAFVTDFGLAKVRDDDARVSTSGMALGTPAYMSPEQARGRPAEIDARSDVYGLGATLYHVLTGAPPFAAEGLGEMLYKVQAVDPVPPRILNPQIAPDLDTICLKAMDKEPSRRYSSAREMADDLGRFLAGEPILACPPSIAYKVRRWVRRRRVALLSLAAGAVLAGAAVAALHFRSRDRSFQAARSSALRARDARDWSAARRECERAIELHHDPELVRLRDRAAKLEALRVRLLPVEQLVRDTRPFFYSATVDLPERLARLDEGLREIDGLTSDPVHAEAPEAWRTLGMGWTFTGDLRRAEDALRAARRLDSGDPWTNFFLARLLVERAQYESVLGAGSEAERKTEARERVRAAGVLLSEPARRWEGAEEIDRHIAEAYLAFTHDDGPAVLRLCDEGLVRFEGRMGTEEYWSLRAWLTPAKREECYDAALRIRPHYPWASLMLAALRPAERSARLEGLVRIQPRFAPAYILRGEERFRSGDLAGAIADFDRAIELDPSIVSAYVDRAVARGERLEYEKAIRDCTRALELRPGLALAYFVRGNARRGMNDLPGAIRDYSDAIHLDPRHAESYVNRGNCRFDSGDAEGAIADFTEALRLRPRDADAMVNRGVAYEALGRLDEAIADHTAALEIDPRHAAAWMNRGLARLKKGDLPGAIVDLEKCLEVAPEDWPNRRQVGKILADLRK